MLRRSAAEVDVSGVDRGSRLGAVGLFWLLERSKGKGKEEETVAMTTLATDKAESTSSSWLAESNSQLFSR